jgi:hypothetical protein
MDTPRAFYAFARLPRFVDWIGDSASSAQRTHAQAFDRS